MRAAGAAMFATANLSVGGFDVRCFRLQPATARQVMFDVKANKPEVGCATRAFIGRELVV
jgi:hypothetical protein